ncbi:hypothetical protein D4765_03450 [Subtercola vilae]|uniref:Uncharacterized protein n=1 Tax=Subtercola vilae TaxID=2056433 RepID=A0A4T2C959_9MICO|nr:hypothetical protein D4765_03450 [Subtercola vilae]
MTPVLRAGLQLPFTSHSRFRYMTTARATIAVTPAAQGDRFGIHAGSVTKLYVTSQGDDAYEICVAMKAMNVAVTVAATSSTSTAARVRLRGIHDAIKTSIAHMTVLADKQAAQISM